jgi:glutaredoxin
VLYTREGCRLCTHARDALRRLGRDVAFELHVEDVDAAAPLAERYGDSVPVVAVEGVEVSAGRIDAAAVRRAVVGSRGTEA